MSMYQSSVIDIIQSVWMFLDRLSANLKQRSSILKLPRSFAKNKKGEQNLTQADAKREN